MLAVNWRIYEMHETHDATIYSNHEENNEIKSSYRENKIEQYPISLAIDFMFFNCEQEILSEDFQFFNITFVNVGKENLKPIKKFSYTKKEVVDRFKDYPGYSLIFKQKNEDIYNGFDLEKIFIHISNKELITEEDIITSLNNDKVLYELKYWVN